MMNKQGPVFIEEPCGCRVDKGIPTRCAKHALKPPMMASDFDICQRCGNWRSAHKAGLQDPKTAHDFVLMASDVNDLAKQIQAWREDDEQGYDTAIDLLCKAEDELGRLHTELEKAQQERREPEDVAALRLKLGTELVNGLVARAEAAEAENRTLKAQLEALEAELVKEGQRAYEGGEQAGFHKGLQEGRNEERRR